MILGDGGSAMVLRCGDKVGALSDKSDPFEAIDRLVRESFRADIEAVVLASNDASRSGIRCVTDFQKACCGWANRKTVQSFRPASWRAGYIARGAEAIKRGQPPED